MNAFMHFRYDGSSKTSLLQHRLLAPRRFCQVMLPLILRYTYTYIYFTLQVMLPFSNFTVITLFLLQQTICHNILFSCQVHHKTVQARSSIYPHTKQINTFIFSRSKVLAAVSHPWRFKSSRMWHCVVGWPVIRILKDHSVFIVKVDQSTSTLSRLLHSEDKGTVNFWNSVTYTLNSSTVSHPRRLKSSVCTSLLTAEHLDGEVWDMK